MPCSFDMAWLPVGHLEELLRPHWVVVGGLFHHDKSPYNPDACPHIPSIWSSGLGPKSPFPGQTGSVDINVGSVAKVIRVGISPCEITDNKEDDPEVCGGGHLRVGQGFTQVLLQSTELGVGDRKNLLTARPFWL